MSSTYVPPWRRNVNIGDAKSPIIEGTKQDDGLRSINEIKDFFWSQQETGDIRAFSPKSQGTLQDSFQTPGSLAYIMLFDGANPRWDKDHIIFARSNLDLLKPRASSAVDTQTSEETCEEVTADLMAPRTTQPIAIFKQQPRASRTSRCFKFQGWHKVENIDFLQPKSDELIRMLEQKWSTADRDGAMKPKTRSAYAWKDALEHEWAVIKLVAVEDGGLEAPEVQKLQDREPEPPKKSVNEMLAELRLGGKNMVMNEEK